MGEVRFSPGHSTTEALSAGAHEALFKASPKADALIPAADDSETLPASQLKSPFQGYSVYPNTPWDGTMQWSRPPASQSNSPFQVLFWKSNLILSETPPATTSPAPVTTFLHQQPPSCTGDYFPTAATTSLEPTITFLTQQLPVLNQRSPSCSSNYQSGTNSYQSCNSDHQSWQPDLHQQLPVLHQRPPSGNADCPPYAIPIFTIRHNKIWPSKQSPCFVILASFVINHLYFKSLRGRYIYRPRNICKLPLYY